jgi:hypothetical protein
MEWGYAPPLPRGSGGTTGRYLALAKSEPTEERETDLNTKLRILPDRKMARVTTINLGKLLATSLLSESGGFRSLPTQAILTLNTKAGEGIFPCEHQSYERVR